MISYTIPILGYLGGVVLILIARFIGWVLYKRSILRMNRVVPVVRGK